TPPAPATTPAMVPSTPRVRRPLGLTLGLLALVAAIVPLVVAALLLFDVNADVVRADARALHTAVAQDLARAIDDAFDDARSDLGVVAAALVDADRPGDQRISIAVSLVSASRVLDAVGIYGADGTRIDVIGDGSAADLPTTLPDTIAAHIDDGFIVGDVKSTSSTTPSRLFVAMPISNNGVRTGAVATWISLGPVQEQVERLSALSLPGYANALFVVDRHRRFVAHTSPALAFNLDDGAREPLVAGLALAGDRPLASNFVTQAEAVRVDGSSVVGTSISLAGAGSGFVVVAQMPTATVYASLDRMRRLAGIVVGGAAALALIGALVVARSITKPVKQLVDDAAALAARRFDAVDGLPKRNDELAVLGGALHGAAVSLQASEKALLEETRLREGLGRYLPSQLVDAWVARRDRDLLAGKRTEVTVLFADIVGFTPLSAQMVPEDLTGLLNDLFTILTEIVFKHGGTVDKFIGDSVMAFWGAPIDDPDHAAKACEAARDMMRFLDVGNLRWKKRYGIEIKLAIGINTGVAVVGNLGSEKRLVYTAIGEPVNIAARLETVAGPMQILASRATVDAAREHDAAIAIGPHELAGVARPIDVFVIEV
ncbi:MAG TPA: adenylate/guanylate cyclase domain-containing protein, partial [Myxococcota bacterium]